MNPKNPQHVTKNCETYGSNVHTTSYHNDIEWFRKRETLQATNAESFKASKNESSSALRSKTPTKRPDTQVSLISVNEIKQILRNPTLLLLREVFDFSALVFSIQNIQGLTYKGYSDSDYVECNMNKKSTSGKGASSVARQNKEETFNSIKLEDHAKLVSHVQPSFKDLDSHEDNPVIVVDDTDEDEEDKIHAATNDETEDTLATKGGSSKQPTGSKTGHSKKIKESSSTMDSNPSQPLVSIPMDTEMHKEDQQETGVPTSLEVTSEERANPQLSSGDKTEGFDQITNKNAIIPYSLANGINIDYANIFWEDIIIKLKKKQREKVVPYTRFLSLMIMHKMKEGYRDDEVTLYPT
nr:hypothetical protein [Tanacetum cinerariifolium]